MLPKSTLDKLDKASRSFMWGSSPERRKQHLVAWKRVCLPKSDGGLGIREAYGHGCCVQSIRLGLPRIQLG